MFGERDRRRDGIAESMERFLSRASDVTPSDVLVAPVDLVVVPPALHTAPISAASSARFAMVVCPPESIDDASDRTSPGAR